MLTRKLFHSLTFIVLFFVFVYKPSEADGISCSSLTAAYSNGQRLLLFNGKRYTSYDETTKQQLAQGWVKDLYRGMPDVAIDAALKRVKSHDELFLISGDKYYKIKRGRRWFGPRPLSRMFPRHKDFRKGIDASAVHVPTRKVFYFKGCTVIRKDNPRRRRVTYIRKMGLPCDVDAAWYDSGTERLVVNKGPFTWSVDVRRRKSYPFCFFCPN